MKKNVNKKSSLNEQKVYQSIMRDISPVIKRMLNESAEDKDIEECDELEEQHLNELFGIGSATVKKPEKEFSVDNSDEENAEIIMQYCAYFLNKASNNVAKGVSMFMEHCGKWIIKAPMLIVTGILKVISRTIKLAVMTPGFVANVILMGISILVKLVKSGVEKSKEALDKLYAELKAKLVAGYKTFKANTESVIKSAGDKFNAWLSIATAAVSAVVAKVEGAVDTFKEWVDQVIADAKEKVAAAVLITKTWFSCKYKAVVEYITSTGKEIKSIVVKEWNNMEKSIRKAYNSLTESIEKLMQDLSDLAEEIGKKVSDAVEKGKAFVVDKKDKALVYNIQKSVKALSDKFGEDEVVALVRKCYNESLVPDVNGNYRINEAYFYERGSKRRKLYENRKATVKSMKRV